MLKSALYVVKAYNLFKLKNETEKSSSLFVAVRDNNVDQALRVLKRKWRKACSVK